LSEQERTVLSGNRDVPFKTIYPRIFSYLINELTMYPFYVLQLAFQRSEHAMVIYSELKK
jgi:hypothetical protein